MKKQGLLAIIVMVVAQGSVMMAQHNSEEYVKTFDIGGLRISVLSEERRNGKIDALAGVTPEMSHAYLADGTYPSGVNAFLVQTQEETVLVDAGFGRKLFDNLQSLGIGASDIGIILLTHMHGDHIGGLLRDGHTAFPKAELYLSKMEYGYWMSDREMQAAPGRQGGFQQARNVIAAYGEKVHVFTPADLGAERPVLLSGIQGIAAYGHTPGHTAYLIGAGALRLLIWGDVNHAMSIQMPYPDVTYARDTDPAQAIETRKRTLEYLSANHIPVAGMHIPFPGIGLVISVGNGAYAFESY